MIKFLISLLILTTTISVLIFIFYLSEILPALPFLDLFFANLFFTILTFIVGSLSLIGIKSSKHQIFIKSIGAGTFIRLLFSLLYIAIYLIYNPIISIPFFIGFLLLYFSYSIFEITFLVANLRPDSENPTDVKNNWK
jgi:hypothetical protein